MPRSPASPKPSPARRSRSRAADSSAAAPPAPAKRKRRTPTTPPESASVATASGSRGGISRVVIVLILITAAVAYRFRDKVPALPIPGPVSADTQLARDAVRHHSQLLISEIIAPLQKQNDGTLTAEAALQLIKDAHPVIDRHTWSPLADRLTDLQTIDPATQQPTGLLDREGLSRFLNDCEAGIR